MTQTKSRDVILREEDFVPMLQEASQPLGRWIRHVRTDPQLLARSWAVLRMGEEARVLETFLDDVGARENRTFVILGELVASLRGLIIVKGIGLHVRSRVPRYVTAIQPSDLLGELDEAHGVVDRSIMRLMEACEAEAQSHGISWAPGDLHEPGDEPVQRQLLPRNVDLEESVDERQHIAEIGARFRKVLEGSRNLNLGYTRNREDLPEFVANHATEARCRFYESAVHNLQSMYDTYVLNTRTETEHPWLPVLRGHISIALHLLEMATELVHFYERHENDIRHEPVSFAIARVVKKADILHVAVNICLRQAYLYVESSSETAERLLETFVPQGSVELDLPEGMVLHARPLALIVQVARHYGTPIEISFDGESCSAGSLMSLIMLGGKHPKPKSIVATGDSRALRDLQRFFEAGMGEGGKELPAGLEYLKTSA